MVVKEDHQALLRDLKAKVRMLARKEERAKDELRAAVKKMRKMASTYKKSLAEKMRTMQDKLVKAQAHGYVKAAVEMEQLLLKGVEKKARAVASAAARMERKIKSKKNSKGAKKTKTKQGRDRKER